MPDRASDPGYFAAPFPRTWWIIAPDVQRAFPGGWYPAEGPTV